MSAAGRGRWETIRETDADPCAILDWDSDFWGQRTARVAGDSLTEARCAAIDAWCCAHRVACLYFLARADDPETTALAEAHEYHLMDIRMTLRRAAAGTLEQSGLGGAATVLVRPYHRDDGPMLEAIARVSHRHSRFYSDRHFPRAACDALYAAWIAKSCDGDADAVRVAERGGRPVGYITCHRDAAGGGTIGLLAVWPEARGEGIGQHLVRDALAWFTANGVARLSVVTQGRNRAAQRLYQRCGFLTDDISLWYHKWYLSGEVPG